MKFLYTLWIFLINKVKEITIWLLNISKNVLIFLGVAILIYGFALGLGYVLHFIPFCYNIVPDSSGSDFENWKYLIQYSIFGFLYLAYSFISIFLLVIVKILLYNLIYVTIMCSLCRWLRSNWIDAKYKADMKFRK